MLRAQLGRWGAASMLNAVRNMGSANPNSYQPVGTLAWMAPEMLVPPYQEDEVLRDVAAFGKCDVYGFGCILYELITRRYGVLRLWLVEVAC